MPITAENFGEFAERLRTKLLVTNVEEQAALVRRGIGDVNGAAEVLAEMPDWRALQRAPGGDVVASRPSAGGGGGLWNNHGKSWG